MTFPEGESFDFQTLALDTFRYQAARCPVYKRYIELLGVDPERVDSLEKIPYLPIELFRTHRVYTEGEQNEAQVVFTSSGTTGAETSRHYVASADLYEKSFMQGFEYFYGKPQQYSIFALLPAYLERQGSSLTYMVERLHAQNPDRGGFFLYDHPRLAHELALAHERNERILLIGVTFALVDFAENFPLDLNGAIIMETGGMKGRRREIERTQMHALLRQAFNVNQIHSEYGMTELLSQAYSRGGERFDCPPWMRITVRSLQNPLQVLNKDGTVGGINIIDLANRYSCSFIATADQGATLPGGGFRIDGRIRGEQLRGCNMLVE